MAKTFSPKSPDADRPECRRGTRSHREYMKYSCVDAGDMTAVMASRRQFKKGWKLAQAGVRAKDAKGRVIRAVIRFHDSAMADHDYPYYS